MTVRPLDATAHTVARQAAEIVERSSIGAATGTFSVGHLGPALGGPLLRFALTSEAAERSFARFIRASFDFAQRRNAASELSLATRAIQLDDMLTKASLQAHEVAAIRKELQQHLLAVSQASPEAIAAAKKVLAATRRGLSTRFASRSDVTRDVLAAKAHVAFLDVVAALSHPAAKFNGGNDMSFLIAYRKMAAQIGADLDGGWRPAIEYLLRNAPQVKAYRQKLERLEAAIAKETDPAKLAHLRDKAFEAERKRGVHSKLKGILGELYASRWRDWRLIRGGYVDIAKRLARRLGSDWDVVPATGRIFLGGAESWDEAILLVRRGSNPPEAKLFLAGQIKVALDPDALQQTLKDIGREAGARDLRIVLADGHEEWFLLSPLPAGEVARRWVLSAAGGTFPRADIAALFERGVQVHQQTLPMTIDEFNLLADRLLKVVSDLFE
jgi:hypothetical protein